MYKVYTKYKTFRINNIILNIQFNFSMNMNVEQMSSKIFAMKINRNIFICKTTTFT